MLPIPGFPQVLPPPLVFLAKLYLLFGVFVWTRATLPRLRIDQLMGFAWKFLLPLALVNIGITAAEMLLPIPGFAQVMVMVVINWILAGLLIYGWARAIGSNSKLGSHELRERAARMRALMAAQSQ